MTCGGLLVSPSPIPNWWWMVACQAAPHVLFDSGQVARQALHVQVADGRPFPVRCLQKLPVEHGFQLGERQPEP